jgi:membrane-associated PAP2 superfamily phosphatase
MSNYTELPTRTLKVAHLVIGVVFLGIAGVWALSTNGNIGWSASAYLAPAVLVAAGVIGLLAGLVSHRGRRNPSTSPDSEDTDSTEELR